MLYHFSEEGDIAVFEPRAPLKNPETEPLVWAIDEVHAPVYCLPRDCPRVTFWPLPSSTEGDIERWMIDPAARMVICVEAAWLDRICTAELFRYEMPMEGFIDCHDHGVHVSRFAVRPLGVTKLGDLPRLILESGAELRFCQSLVPIGTQIQQTSLHFSMMRMRNAVGWTGGPGTPLVPR